MDITDLISNPLPRIVPQQLDPLRLLSVGSQITIEVAADPSTGKFGIRFQDTFYPIDSFSKKQVGMFLKVIVQSNLDQIVLKMIDQLADSSVVSKQRSDQSQPYQMTVEDKKILRDALTLIQKPIQDIVDTILNVKSLNKKSISANIEKEVVGSSVFLKNDPTVRELIHNDQMRREVDGVKTNLNTGNYQAQKLKSKFNQDTSFYQEAYPTPKFSNTAIQTKVEQSKSPNSSTSLTLEEKEIIKMYLFEVTRQLISQIPSLLKDSSTKESKFFDVLKGFIDKQIRMLVDNQINALTDEDLVSNHIAQKELIFDNEKQKITPKLRTNPIHEKGTTITKIEEHIVGKMNDSIQALSSQISMANEILQKIHLQQSQKLDGSFFFLPLFIHGNRQFVQMHLSQDSHESHSRHKNRSQLFKMKLIVPFIGEIVIEALIHDLHIEMSVYVESEESKTNFESVKDSFIASFQDSGLNMKLTGIFVMKQNSFVPSWVSQELGVEQLV